MERRSWGAIGALIMGALLTASSFTSPAHATIAGPVMMLGAAAYMTAKRRGLSDHNLVLKLVIEGLCLLAVLFLWLGQRNLKGLMAADPVPNIIIPLWVLVAYTVAALKPRTRKRARASYEVFGD